MDHEPRHSARAPAAPKLLDRLRLHLQQQFPAERIDGCLRWVTAFIHYHGLRHPRELTANHVSGFLDHTRKAPDSTPQREAAARAALRLLYDDFLQADGPPMPDPAPAPDALHGLEPEDVDAAVRATRALAGRVAAAEFVEA
jgi:hypothetical protein